MARTILDVLVKPNPSLDSRYVTPGSNTANDKWIPVNNWRIWRDFTYDNLMSIYRKVLQASWSTAPSIDEGSGHDIEIWDEHTLDFFLVRFMFPVVNGALARANEVLQLHEVFYLGPGSWTGSMDWALVSRERVEGGRYYNLLPGDTKLSAKWHPKMGKSSNDGVRYQWSLPLSQATTYSVRSNCRYGFIITDKHLVLVRISSERDGGGLAIGRPPRQLSHRRIISAETDISSGLDAMSLDSFGAQSYSDDNLLNKEFQPPEYVVVPWASHGAGQLTVKMALFCLCLMAGRGDTSVDTDYPAFDSWRKESRHLYRHNTSGLTEKRLPKGARLENPQVTTSHYEDQSQEQGYGDEEGQDALDGDEEGYGEGDAMLPEADEEIAIGEQQQLIQSGTCSSSSKGKRVVFTVQLKVKDGNFYFRDFQENRIWTTRTDWTISESGWQYTDGSYIYFAERLPRGM
ncbi:hypothetical protein CONLIGDRAFT_594702 [Coniochaeta ligniaria NRRL 30616]|uniref:Uncharacterized protein n=1 Tax=Coniochaeta ligniaria NRRL 30616 TaxID=1408157 RepID=A0A1J7JN79_9PEZI|nr:hypothetical protein CONLIGDRAFT_594702 [Coniochaeta ligniaria NRRL 30616]